MRTNLILTFNTIASLVAGALFVAAWGQSDIGQAVSLAAAGAVVGVGGLGWGWFKLHRGLRNLNAFIDGAIGGDQKTGLRDFDAVIGRIALAQSGTQDGSVGGARELSEIKLVLAQVDRRQETVDRDGREISSATRLRLILKGYGGELDSNIRQAIACGREIGRATKEIVLGSEAQSDAVAQTTSYVEQLSSQIISVSDGAEAVSKQSALVKNSAQEGVEQFEEIAAEMKQIRNQTATRERRLQTLSQHTKEIEVIVQTIGTLSSRTDLLALNASIESVRAGEHGRGFAIVADEVRALAEQSAQAVADISRRIEMIQLDTHQSMSVASDEHDRMHQVIKRVTETLSSLHELCDVATDSSEGVASISESTHRQLKLTRDVIESLERNAETSQKNRSRAEGAHWTAKTLDQLGGQLEGSLELFRRAESGADPQSELLAPAHGHQAESEMLS